MELLTSRPANMLIRPHNHSHKFQQLPLISIDDFLDLQPEHAADDEKSLMFARINHELLEREALEQARQGLLKKKQSLIAENKKRKDDLANLDKDLETFIDVSGAPHTMYIVEGTRLIWFQRLRNRFKRPLRNSIDLQKRSSAPSLSEEFSWSRNMLKGLTFTNNHIVAAVATRLVLLDNTLFEEYCLSTSLSHYLYIFKTPTNHYLRHQPYAESNSRTQLFPPVLDNTAFSRIHPLTGQFSSSERPACGQRRASELNLAVTIAGGSVSSDSPYER